MTTKVNIVYLRGKALVSVLGKGSFELDVEPKDAWRLPDMVRNYFTVNNLGEVSVNYTGTAGKVRR